MSIEEKRRAAFEAHILKREGKKFHAAWDLSRDGDGYDSWQTHRSWEDWNAALDNLVIELPDPRCDAQERFLLVIEHAIESAGLKVKP